MAEQHCDVIIVGGGLVGLPMGKLLADAGLRVTVLDRADPKAILEADFDGRVTALSLASKHILAGAGLWDGLADHAQPIDDIRVADGNAPFFLHFDHREVGDHPFGWFAPNTYIRRALDAGIQDVDGLDVLTPVDITSARHDDKGATVTLADGRIFTSDLLIAADGRNSRLREQAGISSHEWSYKQNGIVCAIYHEKPHNGIALEHFHATGPFAILPMVDAPDGRHQSGIVWCEPPANADRLMGLSEDDFTTELRNRAGDWLGQIDFQGLRFSWPLALSHAHQYYADRLALIGDAAHGMHPIAGQGLNLGLRDVALLAELIVDARRHGKDIGDKTLLRRYDRKRRFDTTSMMGATDILNKLFTMQSAPARHARSLGLGIVNRVGPLRRMFARGAMGGASSLIGSEPRLARGEKL